MKWLAIENGWAGASDSLDLTAKNSAESPHSTGWLLAGVSIAMAAASLVAGWIMPINDDDVFYLHTWWLYGQGYVAHRDFLGGLPGLWLLLAPAAWLPWTPSGFAAFGRALVAGTFGLSFYLVGRLVRAYRWEALLLGTLGFIAMVWGEVFVFRRAYFELSFLMLHCWLLERLWQSKRVGWMSFGAGWAVGMICTISQRGFYYLPIQPIFLLWILWDDRRALAKALGGWVLGLVVAALPTAGYLTWHGLWAEEWNWSVVFLSTLPDLQVRPLEVLKNSWGLVGAVACAVVWTNRSLPRESKKLLTTAWLGGVVALMMNKLPIHYTYVFIHLISMGLIVLAVRTVLDRLPLGRIGQRVLVGGILLGAMLLAWQRTLGHIMPYETLAPQRQVRLAQQQVLDWLHQIAQDQPVLAIDPYHPILTPNATFLRGSWQYMKWVEYPFFQEKLLGLADQVLTSPPPVITASPWPKNTQHKDLIAWLADHQILTPTQTEKLRHMLSQQYLSVRFPEIASARFPSGTFCYGDTFWIRRDRFQACPPPEIEYIVQEITTGN